MWHDADEYLLDTIKVTKLAERSCKPIVVSPAFGISNVIDTQAQLELRFSDSTIITPWFYLLPQHKKSIFLGNPLLRSLKLQLLDHGDSLTIQDETITLAHGEHISRQETTLLQVYLATPLEEIKTKFPGLFSATFNMKVKHDYKAWVTLQSFEHTRPKARFSSGDKRAAIALYVEQSLENGLIEKIAPNELVALSPVFPIQQSADKIRVVTDLRDVNKALQYTPRPIPTTQSILSDLSKKKIFSAIDIRKAYQQIPLEGDALGIITEFGSYKFTHLPYGLASAPYWWGEFLQSILQELPTRSSTVVHYYYDDIIIASENPTEHREVLHELFRLLLDYGLSTSEEKLQLAQDHVIFLGYDIAYNQIQLDPAKLEAIDKWELPTTKASILSFIGFVNFLRDRP